MKCNLKFFLTLLCSVFCFASNAQNQSQNMCLQSFYIDDSAAFEDGQYNDIWGYISPSGREIAIFGGRAFTYFVDVTDPLQPTLLHKEAGSFDRATWRDYKTYKNYVYGVTDNNPGSLQIFDMSEAPAIITKVYDSDLLIKQSHNCFIENGRLYAVSGRNAANVGFELRILDIKTDPENPKLLSSFDFSIPDRIHDIFVRNDTAWINGAYDGLFVMDLKDPINPITIGSINSYPGKGYNHSVWLTDDSKYAVFVDEVPTGLPLKM
ncbi:MAG: choice-of-anchor B domain-containing protein, partial [Sphingobacteriales bacterium]